MSAKGETSSARQRIYRHSRIVRLCHWINVVCFVALLYTGMQMLLDYPELYWGHVGFMGHEPALHLRDLGLNVTYTEYGHHVLHVAGYEFSGDREWGRYNHFFYAWMFALNGLLYLIWNLLNRHFWRDMVPAKQELQPRRLGRELWQHLPFRSRKSKVTGRYNTIQKLTYLTVIFLFCTLMTLSGLAQSPGFVAAFPVTLDLFGGRQTARSIHVILTVLMVGFVVVHVVQVIASGFLNQVRSMITGTLVVSRDAEEEHADGQ